MQPSIKNSSVSIYDKMRNFSNIDIYLMNL